MKKNSLILIVIINCLINTALAQDLNQQKQNQAIKHGKKNAISFYPLNFLNFNEPSFQLGYERRLREKLAIKIAGGLLPPGNFYDYTSFYSMIDKSYSCYKINLEIKYIALTSKSQKHNLYFSSDAFYTNVNSKQRDIYEDLLGEQFEEISELEIIKMGLNLKIGKQFFFKNFLLELYGGVGLGKYFEDIYKKERAYENFTNPYDEISEKSLEYYRINFPFNVIIGYRF